MKRWVHFLCYRTEVFLSDVLFFCGFRHASLGALRRAVLHWDAWRHQPGGAR